MEFLNIELALGFTFAETARTIADGNSKENAKKAVATIHHFLPRVEDQTVRRQFVRRMRELDEAISSL